MKNGTPHVQTLERFSECWPRFELVFRTLIRSQNDANVNGYQYFESLARIMSQCLEPLTHDSLSVEQVCATVEAVERVFNLSLLYFEYENDFSLYECVGSLELEGVHSSVLNCGGAWDFIITEDGFVIAREGEEHLPLFADFAFALDLELNGTKSERVAKLREIEHELFRLVDIWEYRNTVLAKQQNQARAEMSKIGQQTYQEVVEALGARREHMARWVVVGFSVIQDFVAESRGSNADDDVLQELLAIENLALSGLQKVFLPSAVSRQKYSRETVEALWHWARKRHEIHPTDLASELVLRAYSLCIGKDANTAFDAFEKKNFEWRLGFDPLPAIKTVSWMLHPETYDQIVTLLFVAVCRKLLPEPPSSFWLNNIAAAFDMRESFAKPHLELGSPFPVVPKLIDLTAEVARALVKASANAENEEALTQLRKRFANI